MDKQQLEQAVAQYCHNNGYDSVDLKAAMFDMDGVLFDSMKNHAYCWHKTMAHFGFDLPEWEAYMHEGRTGAGTINIVSNRERGHDATEAEIQEIYKYKSDLFCTRPKAERMPGSYELLTKVKASGVTPMVVTGSGQMALLDRLNKNFPNIFIKELMVTAFDVKFGKPNPEPYLMGMEKYVKAIECESFDHCKDSKASNLHDSIRPNNFIVVENAPLGVQAGVAAGVFTIAVNTGPLPDNVLLDEGANVLYHSMQELCDNWEVVCETLCKH